MIGGLTIDEIYEFVDGRKLKVLRFCYKKGKFFYRKGRRYLEFVREDTGEVTVSLPSSSRSGRACYDISKVISALPKEEIWLREELSRKVIGTKQRGAIWTLIKIAMGYDNWIERYHITGEFSEHQLAK